MLNQSLHLYMPSSPIELTIVVACWPGSPKVVTDRFQRVLNAAARVVTNTRKYV